MEWPAGKPSEAKIKHHSMGQKTEHEHSENKYWVSPKSVILSHWLNEIILNTTIYY